MAAPAMSPNKAVRAGNGSMVTFAKGQDPAWRAYKNWNETLVVSGTPPKGAVRPDHDNRAYDVVGSTPKYCRPYLRVSYRRDWLEGPEVRFVEDDEGLSLTAVFEEDPGKRVQDALPFDVRATAVKLQYGPSSNDVLALNDVLQEPLDEPADGPAFRIEARGAVPSDERRARIVAALQTNTAAKWLVSLEFPWESPAPAQTRPAPIRPAPGRRPPAGGFHHMIGPPAQTSPNFQPKPREAVLVSANTARARAPAARPAANARTARPSRPVNVAIVANATVGQQVALRPQVVATMLKLEGQVVSTTRTESISFTRALSAHYPRGLPENDRIYAAVTGEYARMGWRNSAHGWYQPTPVLDTVYCLPDAYRLERDPGSGLPAILPVLTVAEGATDTDGTVDPEDLRMRLSFRIAPDFDPDRLNRLRGFVRGVSHGAVTWADLVLGGYRSARFVADESLSGLGGLLEATVGADQGLIDAEGGFMLTYEGTTELLALLVERLKGQGIRGKVELDLESDEGESRTQIIPVVLTLAQTAPAAPIWTVTPPPVAEDGEQGTAQLVITNNSARPLQISRIEATSLLRTPTTGQALSFQPAQLGDTAGAMTLAPGETRTLALELPAGALANAWDVRFLGVQVETGGVNAVLHDLFDASTAEVRGWAVEVDCPPLEFFEQLAPEDQERFRGVVAVEVEFRKPGDSAVHDLRLTRAKARDTILLSRSMLDLLDPGLGGNQFEYRTRMIRLTQAGPWGEWREDRGSAVSVFLA